MRLQRSFVGRDDKLLAQQLPVVFNSLLGREWTSMDAERRATLTTITRCLFSQGELVSLLFMGEIASGFTSYKQLVQLKVDEFVRAIHDFDDALAAGARRRTNGRISSKPRVHLLHHLQNDLDRFATSIHYETEKGEQFNKLIREHLFHTNRHLPSRDVLLLFSRQFMFRHVTDGGSWVTKRGKRVQAGAGIEAYIDNDPKFRSLYLGYDRDYADNNSSPKSLKNSLAGLFAYRATGHPFFGRVTAMDTETVQIEKLEIVTVPYPDIENAHLSPRYGQFFPASLFTDAKKDAIGNPVIRRSEEDLLVRGISQIDLVDVLDIQPS